MVLLHRRRAPSRTLVEVRSREELGYLREDLVGDERADGAERVGALSEALPAAGELEGQNLNLPGEEKVLPGVEASGVASGLRHAEQAELGADDGGAQARGGGAADERLGGVDLYHGGARAVVVKGRARPRRDRERRENARASKVCHSPPSRPPGMRAIAGGYRTRARMARACTFVLVLVLLALLELALRRRGGEGRPRPSPRTRRHPQQFNDVGNIVNAGIGGFPNAIYRDWWAPL